MLPNWFATQAHFFERNVSNVPLRVLQIGAYTGDATQWLLANKEIVSISDVDTWEGSDENAHHSIAFSEVEQVWDSRFKDNPKVKKYKMTSDEYYRIADETFNFIYIDGDHTALQTALDALNGFRLLEEGGIMAFDDYGWVDNPSEFLRPKRGIDAFLNLCTGEYRIKEIGYQVWVQKC
jgi:predicted O-methyltransferase YrrM